MRKTAFFGQRSLGAGALLKAVLLSLAYLIRVWREFQGYAVAYLQFCGKVLVAYKRFVVLFGRVTLTHKPRDLSNGAFR